MYSIIETGGFQQKVELGQTIRIPLVTDEVGSEIEFKSVLLASNGKEVQVGTPVLDGYSVKGEVLAKLKDKKVKVFKKKRRQGYRLTKGHRQDFVEVVITELNNGGATETVDAKVVEQAKKRAAAIANAKEQNVPLTRKEKIEKGLEPTNRHVAKRTKKREAGN